MTEIMSSVSSSPQHVRPTIMDDAMDTTHLSGMTMAEFVKQPQMNLVHPILSASQRSSFIMNQKRASTATASTTKSQLRQTNQVLINMLDNIQQELAAHRAIMLDIQQRVSHLEYESSASTSPSTPRTALDKLQGKQESKQNLQVPLESRTWWEACQNYARNAEPPMSPREFLRTPVRYSGFDFEFQLPIVEPTPPATPPSIADLPPLTPTSDGESESESESIRDMSPLSTPSRHEIRFDDAEIMASTPEVQSPDAEAICDICERTVEVVPKQMPTPPTLQPPPSGKGVVVKGEEVATAVEPEIATSSQRYFKGVKSLITYKALLKNKQTDKEHSVLIHFHRKADLKHLDD